MSMETPRANHSAQPSLYQVHRELGQLTGVLGETVARLAEGERRFEGIEKRMIEVLAVVGRAEVKNVLLASICGAFTGTLAGAATSIMVVYYVVTKGVLN